MPHDLRRDWIFRCYILCNEFDESEERSMTFHTGMCIFIHLARIVSQSFLQINI